MHTHLMASPSPALTSRPSTRISTIIGGGPDGAAASPSSPSFALTVRCVLLTVRAVGPDGNGAGAGVGEVSVVSAERALLMELYLIVISCSCGAE
jgi:hypothetical protein